MNDDTMMIYVTSEDVSVGDDISEMIRWDQLRDVEDILQPLLKRNESESLDV